MTACVQRSVQMVKKNMPSLNVPSRDADSRETHVSVRAKRDAKPHNASCSYTRAWTLEAVRNYTVIETDPSQKLQTFQHIQLYSTAI